MRTIRWISVYSAALIVLLHSMVPHAHHYELTVSEDVHQHEQASSILDYIKLGFHMDHGDGQMENFTPDDHSLSAEWMVAQLPEAPQAVWEPVFECKKADGIAHSPSFVSSCLPGSPGLRGPPSLS